MSKPIKVSVILTSYNHAKYLREAINSVLSQTFTNFELIIWDDASTDESWQIITSYSDPRIKAFRNDVQKRGAWGINKAISEIALGEYIAIHHSDDMWEPQKLEKQTAFLDINPSYGAVFTWANIIGEDGELFQDKAHAYYSVFDQPNRNRYEWLNYFFYRSNALCHPSVLIRKVCYEECGPYRYGLAQLGDFDMWVRLCLKYDIHILPEKLVQFRVRSNDTNSSGNRPEVRIRWQFEILQILNNYRNLKIPEEFMKVFPSAIKYFTDEGFDIGFALAMVALEPETFNPAKSFGLQLLFEALNDLGRARKIKRLYGFSHTDFIALTAKHDVFSMEMVAFLTIKAAEQEQVVQEKEDAIQTLTAQMQALDAQIAAIEASRAWKLAMALRRIRYLLLPSNSLRERLVKFFLKGLKWIFVRLNRLRLIFHKALDLYNENGVKITLYQIQNKVRLNSEKGHSFQSLLSQFPQKFADTQDLPRSARQWKIIIDSSAKIALQKLMIKINILGDASSVLSAFKDSLGEDKYYQVLESIFTLEQFMQISSDATVYPLVQASELPKVSDVARRRRILFITSVFPNPNHGGGGRVLNFIKTLSEKNDVYLSTCFNPTEDADIMKTIRPYCRSIQTIPYWRLGRNQVEIQKWLNGLVMDIVHYEWPRSLENYDPGFGSYQIFTYMEAVSLRLLMDLEHIEPLSGLWVEKFAELIYALRLELVDASYLSARIAVTTKDGNFFKELYPYQEYTVLNHGTTMNEFTLPDVEAEPNTLVYVGNYRHYPNVDAMIYFFDKIWKGIRSIVPDARIYLVGPHMPEKLMGLADGKQVIMTGEVTDIRPFIQKASIGIAPLVTGAGLRGKVIEYAALHRTFVATSIATTDLVFKDGLDYLCADTAAEFTQKVIFLLKDVELRKQMGRSAYETAKQNYDTHRLVDFLTRIYEHLEN